MERVYSVSIFLPYISTRFNILYFILFAANKIIEHCHLNIIFQVYLLTDYDYYKTLR
jgi:hypothetical protein